MIYIDKVHYVKDEHGCDVIGKMKYTSNLNSVATEECTKSDMIDYVNKGNSVKTKYYRNNTWVSGENVRVIDNRYLRTDSNNTKSDNLGNLPTY